MNYLYVLLFLLIFVACYIFVVRYYTKHELKKYKTGNKFRFKTKEFSFKDFISKHNFLKTKDLFLSKQGNPLRLDSIRYYLLKISLTIILIIAGIKNFSSFYVAVLLGLLGFFFLDIYIYFHKKSRDLVICSDLYNVINSLYLQLSANVPLKNALKFQFENCKNKEFRKAMIEFSTTYELSGYNIEKATNFLSNSFDITEINIFCNSLQELNSTNNITEILDNLSYSLQDKKIEQLKDSTRNKVVLITVGVIIALTNIIMLIFYPLFISIGKGFNNIFR
jgi:Flp pilus assembly protein TadB